MRENYCVYVHCRKTDNKIFYVGKGSAKRANARSYSGRNNFWGRVVKKHGFYSVILYKNLTNDQACEIETRLISDFGRENLCNLTDGGEGTPGRVVSEKTKKKMSDMLKGTKPSDASIAASIEKNSKPVGTKCGLMFKSTTDAARWLRTQGFPNANKSGIFVALKGESNKAYGYEFRYLDENNCIIESPYIDRSKLRNKSVTNGVDIFESVSQASNFIIKSGLSKAKSINTISANIVSCCKERGRLKTVYGFVWSYVNA